MIPKSCQLLPSTVIAALEQLYLRIERMSWLEGPCDRSLCETFVHEHFRLLDSLSDSASAGSESMAARGSHTVRWVLGDWAEAVEWTRHCYHRVNGVALNSTIEFRFFWNYPVIFHWLV